MRQTTSFLFTLVLAAAVDAGAQPVEPIGPFVIDARGSLARFKGEPPLAGALQVDASNLPTRGLGAAVGGHWYPFRLGRVTIGLGGELVLARDSRTAEAPATVTTTGTPTQMMVERPTVTTRLSAFSPQVSLNFGNNDGWSYISGGIGSAKLTAERDDVPSQGAVERVRSTNYGGGARWFTSPRLAFTFDLRFYTLNAQSAPVPTAYPRTRFMVISVGVSMR